MGVGGGVYADYQGNIREVGQMIQYPKQIRSHIPVPHSSLPQRCDAAVKAQHQHQPATCTVSNGMQCTERNRDGWYIESPTLGFFLIIGT